MGASHGSTVQIITWFLTITSILGVGARCLTKAILVRSVSLDDYLIILSLVCCWPSSNWTDLSDGR